MTGADDLGIRSALGEWLGDGRRLTLGEAEQVPGTQGPKGSMGPRLASTSWSGSTIGGQGR